MGITLVTISDPLKELHTVEDVVPPRLRRRLAVPELLLHILEISFESLALMLEGLGREGRRVLDSQIDEIIHLRFRFSLPLLEMKQRLFVNPSLVFLRTLELLKRPLNDGLREFRRIDDLHELLLKFITRECSPLAAIALASSPGAAVVEVFLHGTRSFDEFALHIQDHHRAALPAPKQTSIGVVMRPLPRSAFPPENHLRPVVLFCRDHGLVLTLHGLPAPLELPVVEGIREDLVESRKVERLRLRVLAGPRLRETALHRPLPDVRYRVGTGEQFFPCQLHERKANGVLLHNLLSLYSHVVALVAERRSVRLPSVLHFLLHPPLHVFTEINGVLRRHPELHGHLNHVIGRRIGLLRCDDRLDDTLLEEPLDAPAVDGIASETVQAPADDRVRLPHFDELEHLSEQRTPRFLRRHFLVERSNDRVAFALRLPFVLLLLRRDGEDLLILLILRTLAVVDNDSHEMEGIETPKWATPRPQHQS